MNIVWCAPEESGRKWKRMKDRRISAKTGYLYFSLIGVLFVFFGKTGKELAERSNLVWNTSYTLWTLGISLAAGVLLGVLVCRLLHLLADKAGEKEGGTSAVGAESRGMKKFAAGLGARLYGLRQRTLFAASTVLIVLCWLPAYLAYYPGICAYDFPIQLHQIFDVGYIDHHPIAHTFLIKMFMKLGQFLFGDVNGGIALFSFCQMVILAFAFAWGLCLLARYRVHPIWIVLMQLLSMLYPFHMYMSISMTKDTLFTVFFLLQMYFLAILLIENRQNLQWKKTETALFVSAVGMILFRNNGKYAMMVLLVILLLVLWRGKAIRRLIGRMLFVCFAAFLAGNLLLSLFFRMADATQGDRREMLSVPIQQFARCMMYHGGIGELAEDDGTMEEEDIALINDFIRGEGYRYYRGEFADPVKSCTNTAAVLQQPGQFAKTYLHLLVQYPGDYINAVLALDAGYLYPFDVSHAVINQKDYLPGKGYVQTRWSEEEINEEGIYKDSKWEWLHEQLETWADTNAYLRIPILRYLFMPGVFLWAYLVLLGYFLVKRKARMCIPLSLVAGYYITMLLGPTVQMRYMYPVMVIFPFMLLLGNCRVRQDDRSTEMTDMTEMSDGNTCIMEAENESI